MNLQEQIAERSKEISTASYSMSVGELLAMYKDGELNLHPEFQRFFRWTPYQKSRLIESLLLGIPIPSIFVSQHIDGKWEVVDGLQRLSTLFELAGELRDREGSKLPPLKLTKTKYLTELDGKMWETEEDGIRLADEAKLRIKRARIDVNIVLSSSDPSAKYELFQRLNTGAAFTTDQEVRNCIMVMVNPDFFSWITSLAKNEDFKSCIPLTDRAMEEQFDLELVTRFIVLRKISLDSLKGINELGVFLDDSIVDMAESKDFDRGETEVAFRRTFETFHKILLDDSFRKFDLSKGRSMGAMLISIFEILALGIGFYAGDDAYIIDEKLILEKHKSLSSDDRFTGAAGSGIRATTRLPVTLQLGRDYFAK